MRIFKNKAFQRFARKKKISDEELVRVIQQAEEGLLDADLGGGLIKQRIARAGQGKSGGYRAIICLKLHSRAVFIFGFAKNSQANLNDEELAAYKDAAKILLNLADEQLELLLKNGEFLEVSNYEKKVQERSPGSRT